MPRRRRKPEIIIVALIDIFAILLIFMVMTTQFKEDKPAQPAVTINRPESKSAMVAESAKPPVVLSVSEQEDIFLDDKKVALDDLQAALQAMLQRTPPPSLALNADKKAPFGTIIKVLDAMRNAGVKGNLSVFTEAQK